MADLIIKGVNIPNKRTIELMRAELACVSRCECDRHCENCDLVQDRDELIVAFHEAIGFLEAVANAVHLPEGHGDLIDRDAFRADNGLGKDCENCDRNTRNCNYDICLSRMDVCGWIDDAPIIVQAEGGADECSEN